MALNDKQREAVEYLEGPLLVLAGPGTGKTYLLSARVEQILKVTDTNPENILCLTFTESGATNMRTRLLSTVGIGARRIEIHTYHAFGADLLSHYKNYAENFERNLDSAIDEVQQFKIVKMIQGELPAMDIMKSANTKDVVSTIGNAKSARLTGEDLKKIAERNISDSHAIAEKISPILESAKKRLRFSEAVATVYQPILEELAAFTSTKNILGEIEPVGNVLTRELHRLIEAEREKEKPKVSSLSKWKDATFEKDDSGHFRLKDRIANKKLLSLGGIMEKYDAKLKEEGLFDFSDMIEQAIEILKKDKGFRLTEQERFQYVLLDEFQDTNPSQAELIKLLTDYEKPNVMAVGDDDQAIFEFQGADASSLLNFQQFYGAKVINLEENYRSKQEILDFSRKIADQIDDSFAKKRGIAKNLRAAKGLGAEIARHEFLTSDQEYQFIADEIVKLIKRGVRQNDIAVIAPKHKYILPLIAFLKAQESINIAYEKRDNILEDPRLGEILTLAQFVFDLSQGRNVSARLLEILSFPFFEVPPAEAVATIYHAKMEHKVGLDYLLKAESSKLRDIAEFLATLVTKSFDVSLELMLDYIVGTVAVGAFRSPFLEFYSREQSEYGTFELYENLAVLREAVLRHKGQGNAGVDGLRLRDLIELIKDYGEAGATLTNTSPYRDSTDAVQIVTAHKAKGLEYEYVFLIAVDNLNWGKAKGNNNMLVLPKNMVQIRHTGATDDERLRLLFVALTRAKRVMLLTNSIKDFSGKSPARLDYLQEYENGEGEVVSPLLGKKVELHYGDLAEVRKEVNLRRSWQVRYAKQTPELLPILKERMKDYRLTASDLTKFIDIAYGGPVQFYQDQILKSPQPPATENMVLGNLIHSAFEKVTKEGISDDEVIDLYRKEAEDANLEPREIKDLLEKGEITLKVSLDEFGGVLREGKAEVDFRLEQVNVDGVPITGKLDHITVNEEEKTIEVYDFKTGKYRKEKWGKVDALYKYMLQLGFYKLLLENSVAYKKYRVVRGHILFVTPDDEGKVYDKVLEFNEKEWREEESQLREIIKAMYEQVVSLAFLGDEELFIEADKNRGIKDIKNFINVLLEKSLKIV